MTQAVLDLSELASHAGEALGQTSWRAVTQDDVDSFARLTGDDQWIHVDPSRAAAGPFGTTIAHGYFTLALSTIFLDEVVTIKGAEVVLNYGSNRVRYPAPVPVGSRIRAAVELPAVDDIPGGVQATFRLIYEVEGRPKPGCVADIVYRYYTEVPAVSDFDPAGLGPVLARLAAGVAADPVTAMGAAAHLTSGLAAAAVQAGARALGWEGQAEPAAAKGDRRFSDPLWDQHPWFLWQRQSYLAFAETAQHVAKASEDDKAEFAVAQLVDALAPTNFLSTNPAALRKAVETQGASVVEGFANYLDDLADNDGRPRQVDRAAFEVGRDLACSPGKVVFRNELVELIQYAPTTKTVHEIPLLLSPPWINRYYVMDLAPGRSFAEWALDHGHATFAMSYRNPDSSMRDVDLEDYMLLGLRAALDAVCDITGAPKVNVAGLCVGGTLAVMLAAFLAELGEDRINSLTLLNTLVDFSRPGPLAHFTDAESVARVEERMAGPGYLDARELATTFDSLRPNDLIWNYVSANWLMGGDPPAFDILAWNADATRVPEATHSTYLRACYLDNRMATGTMTMAGRGVYPSAVTSDTYVLAAESDHITPWLSSYATTRLLGGRVRFVLSSAGHIAGIVNPPGPKRRYWTNHDLAADPDRWRAGAEEHAGSWWEDWARWIGPRAGRRRKPFRIGGDDYPVLADAPGTYVRS